MFFLNIRGWRLAWAVVASVIGACAVAGEPLWLVSTRVAPWASNDSTPGLDAVRVWRGNGTDPWVASNLDALFESDDQNVPTTIFIGGNRYDAQSTSDLGIQIFGKLTQRSQGRPLRMIIWSWPADQMNSHVRQDARIKARRAEVEGFYLAQVLQRMNPKVRVNLIGYSFGARIACDAMELVDGGTVAGRSLPPADVKNRAPFRTVLVAAGMDWYWFLPGWRNGDVLDRLDRALITTNAADPAMKYYRLMNSLHGPNAIGYWGPTFTSSRPEDQAKVEILNVTNQVGGTHKADRYFAVSELLDRMAEYAFSK